MSPAPRGPFRVVVLISGRGSNMLAIARAALSGRIPASVTAVVSDRADAPGLASARELGLECQLVSAAPGEARAEYDHRLAAAVRAHVPDLVVLAGFMRILSAPFVHEFAGRLLNIHPSLLPKHRGLHTHQRVLDAGEREHGCSVHFVTEELDGGPLVIQARVPVEAGDTVQSLSARVQRAEHRVYPMTIDWMATRRLQWHDGTPWLDGKQLTRPVMLDGSGVAS